MISAFEVSQFVSVEQSWRELADTRKFPLPPEFEPECELDAKPNPFVHEPTLILVEFDQIVGQNILLTYPTLTTSAINQLNDSLQVVFGVNYQDVAMSHFSIVPESTSIFPDIEYPTYARYFTVYDVDGRGLVRNCCICFLASTAHQLYKYLDCMEAQISCMLTRLTEENLGLFWRALHSRLHSLEYTRGQVASYQGSLGDLAQPLSPDDARTLSMTDCDSIDSGIACVHGAIQVVRENCSSRSLSLEPVDLGAIKPTLVKIMSIHASDAKREMKPIWRLLGQERDSLTGMMAAAVKAAVKSSDDDLWAWCLPSLLGDVMEQLMLAKSGKATSLGSGGDRGLLNFARSRVGSMASSTYGGTASVDSFKSLASLRSCRDDGPTAAAATALTLAASAGGGHFPHAEEFHSVGSSNSSSMERISARECSWTITNGGADSSLPIHDSLRQAPPVFPNVSADPTAVIRFASAYSQYPYGVSQAVSCLLQGRRVALLCRTESEARLLQQALALFVPFADSGCCSGPWFQKLPVLSALASVPIACVRRSANGHLPSSAPLQRFLCCLDVGSRLYSGPVYQGGVLLPIFGPDIGHCMLHSQEFAVRFIDLILTELAQLTLTVMSLHLKRYQRQGRQWGAPDTTKTVSGASTASTESQRQLTTHLAKFGVSQDDYLIGMHLSKLILGRLCTGTSATGGSPPLSLSLS